jgi:mono/diheme cytochrome c family protein
MRLAWIPVLSLAGAIAACGGDGGSDSSAPPPGTAFTWPGAAYRDVQAVFTASCTGCHGASGNLGLAAPGSWANLVEQPAQASVGVRVVPFSSGTSVLWQRLTGSAGLARMPLGLTPLPQAQIDLATAWIDAGGARQDLRFQMQGMTPHVGQRLVARLVDDSGELRFRAVFDPLPAASFTIFLPQVMPRGDHVLEFWADVNGNGSYDAPPADHAWRVSVPPSGLLSFTHSTSFTDVGAAAPSEPGLPLTFDATGFTPHLGQVFGLSVHKVSDGRLVGSYRLASVPAASFRVTIPGVVEPGEDYRVDFYADMNGNGAYDAPPADHAWRVLQSSDAAGLAVTFAHGTSFTDISR